MGMRSIENTVPVEEAYTLQDQKKENYAAAIRT